jgi:hypothetical protein
MRNFPRFSNKFSLSGIAMLLIIIRRARKNIKLFGVVSAQNMLRLIEVIVE